MEYFVEIINEAAFVPLAEKASAKLLGLATHCTRTPASLYSKRLYVSLVKESMELEDYLDDHGARSNKTWVYYGELVASIRNFASTAYIISHILGRIKFYKLQDEHIQAFIDDSRKRIAFLNETLQGFFAHLLGEAQQLGLAAEPAVVNEADFDDSIVVKVLPQNVNDEGAADLHENATRIFGIE